MTHSMMTRAFNAGQCSPFSSSCCCFFLLFVSHTGESQDEISTRQPDVNAARLEIKRTSEEIKEKVPPTHGDLDLPGVTWTRERRRGRDKCWVCFSSPLYSESDGYMKHITLLKVCVSLREDKESKMKKKKLERIQCFACRIFCFFTNYAKILTQSSATAATNVGSTPVMPVAWWVSVNVGTLFFSFSLSLSCSLCRTFERWRWKEFKETNLLEKIRHN